MEHEEVGTNELCFGPASERRANGTKKGSGGGAFIPDPCSASINCSGRARWPKVQDGVMRLSRAQFEALFEGLDWRRVIAQRVLPPTAAG